MKLIMENWRKHLNELKEGAVPHSAHHVVKKMMSTEPPMSAKQELDERIASKLALWAALAGAGAPAMAKDTSGVDAGEKTQQVDKAEDTSELVKNDDGSYSLTLDIPAQFQKLMPSMKRPFVSNWARAEFAKKMAGVEAGGVIDLNISGRVSSMTADTVTFTGNVVK